MITLNGKLIYLVKPSYSANADFDGDVLNDLALTMEEFWELFDQFSPTAMLIRRTDETIGLDLSALENISTAILSDR